MKLRIVMNISALILSGLISSVALCKSASKQDSLCEHVVLRDGPLKLNANEKVLVCGSSQPESAWREIPLPQAQYELKVLLEARGFLEPKFEREDDTLFVTMGAVTRTKTLEINGGENLLHSEKKRKIRSYPLEPQKIDEVAAWADLKLRRNGYACPKIKVTAHAWDAKISAQIEAGQQMTIGEIRRKGFENLNQESLQRFEAFTEGDEYDVVDTQLTTSRLLNQGLFQSAFIATECRGDKVDLQLVTEVGLARLFHFGLGASTEELPFADLWFKNARLDDRLSNYTVSLHASPIRQSLNLQSEIYRVPFSVQSFLSPRFKIERRREQAYETNLAQVGVDLARDWDILKTHLQARFGPSLNYEKTVQGQGPENLKYISWDANFTAASHAYETFVRDQYEGWSAGIQYAGQRRGVGSELNIDRFDVDFKHLWNVGGFSPPLFVFATRVAGVAVESNQAISDETQKQLPISYRVFYGGADDIRGFSRQSLNNNGLGYLTAARVGLELRLIEELPYHFQPFLLWDAARLGSGQDTFDQPIFTSPGLGLRWPSPFGTLRFSAARGQIWGANSVSDQYPQAWIFFVSFGQEF